MQPKAHELLACRALALRYLVWVMHPDVILTAGVYVKCLAKVLHRHC